MINAPFLMVYFFHCAPGTWVGRICRATGTEKPLKRFFWFSHPCSPG